MKKYFLPLGVLGIFMTVAVTLWLTQDNIFYLFNFSYIGISIFFGYARAFSLCMSRLNLPCAYELTEEHVWNRVKVDDLPAARS